MFALITSQSALAPSSPKLFPVISFHQNKLLSQTRFPFLSQTRKIQSCQICLSLQCLTQCPCPFKSKSTTCDTTQLFHSWFLSISTQRISDFVIRVQSIHCSLSMLHTTLSLLRLQSHWLFYACFMKTLLKDMLEFSHHQAIVYWLDAVSIPHSMLWLLRAQTGFLFAQNNPEKDSPSFVMFFFIFLSLPKYRFSSLVLTFNISLNAFTLSFPILFPVPFFQVRNFSTSFLVVSYQCSNLPYSDAALLCLISVLQQWLLLLQQ